MVDHAIIIAAVCVLLLMLLCLYRAIAGPTVMDRILGGNIIGTKTVVLLLLIGIIYGDLGMFVDISIAYALLSFIATLGSARFFLRRRGSNEILEATLDEHAIDLDEQSEEVS